jgi:PIN domain nuclease of toxin-antitoxin system
MKYLLDTNVWLWSLWDPERISRKAREEVADMSNAVFLSAVTAWEIAIKAAAGKLKLPESPESYVPRRMVNQGLRPLVVTHPHALAVFALPAHHRDPFDRLLVAQAQLEDMILVTADRTLEKYPVEILWAGR